MKLTINKKVRGGRLSEVLNITAERKAKLQDVLQSITEVIKNYNGICNLEDFYVKLADECTNLEEYTFCVHSLSGWIVSNCEILKS